MISVPVSILFAVPFLVLAAGAAGYAWGAKATSRRFMMAICRTAD